MPVGDGGGGGEMMVGGVLSLCMAVVVRQYTLASLLLGRDGARRVFTNQAYIACTKREAP